MSNALLVRFDEAVRKRKAPLAAAYRSEHTEHVRRAIGPFAAAPHNWISHHDFDAEDAPAIIDEQVAAYDAIGHSFRWKVYGHDRPAGLPALLLERGFTLLDTCALLTIESAACAQDVPDGIEYRKLVDPDAFAEELRPITEWVWTEGGGELVESLAMEVRERGTHNAVFAAKENGETVGCGVVRYDETFEFGGLFAGNTVPSARGRGIYRGIVGARARDALSAGARLLYTEAGPMSRPILQHIGFAQLTTVSHYVHACGSD